MLAVLVEIRCAVSHNLGGTVKYVRPLYDDLSAGRVDPHTEQASHIKTFAISVIRTLVDDWL